MISLEIRQSFLDFFKSKNHTIVDSIPIIPHNDPTLLFINAGMNQFKDVFLGIGKRDYNRAANSQKCIRVSGKHNDLEEVGVDTYHHTFFEMLGNWSFGDYYKSEAIEYAWELLTKVWKLDKTRLYATVHNTDDEAYELWKQYLPETHIQKFGDKDNFWEMGTTGPCGPCSEIHYDRTPNKNGAKLINTGSPEVIEIWNLVFIQFNRKEDGTLEPLSSKYIDTGMGFERICSILQNVKSNYDTDIFLPIIGEIQRLTGIIYTTSIDKKTDIAMRVIADHIRTLCFAIADGVLPGNDGRNYVLRRILRRALKYARNLGINKPILYKLVPIVVTTMGLHFVELKKNQELIQKVIYNEEESFLQTMERGLDRIDTIINNILETKQEKIISGDDAFLLYDTFGFPLDLTELIARERGIKVDTVGFENNMNIQKERSRTARKIVSQDDTLPQIDIETEFIGYDSTFSAYNGTVKYFQDNIIVLDKTPFYSESGGQISDNGVLIINQKNYNVINVKKNGNTIFHICDKNIECNLDDTAICILNFERRSNIVRNHSATHILHEALRAQLGNHIQQAGSLVTDDYLRFDFNHFEKLTPEQIKNIENTVNTIILMKQKVTIQELPIEEAKKDQKIKMFFGDKYGSVVRVVSIGGFSSELCGGTHVNNTSEIVLFKITSESSIASGIRRIEAITGKKAIEYVTKLENTINEKNNIITNLNNQIKKLEKEIAKHNISYLNENFNNLINKAISINGINVLVHQEDLQNLDQLRLIAEKIRDSFVKNGICLIASIIDDKVQLSCSVTDDLKDKLPAGKLVGDAAKILNGGGGGKSHLATAGGKNIQKLPDLLNTEFYNIIKKYTE